MISAPNSLNLNCKVRVTKEVPGPSVSEEIADIFTNYNIDPHCDVTKCRVHRVSLYDVTILRSHQLP